MDSKNYIICYTGGTCGDLITALIDNSGASLHNSIVKHLPDRTRLKKPHLFNTDTEKTLYLKEAFRHYTSIPSHDLEYHIRSDHSFISIIVDNLITAQWAAKRFQSLHRPHVWEEMSLACGADSVDSYAQVMLNYSARVKHLTKSVLSLERILNGNIIFDLENMLNISISETNKIFYQQWLTLNERM